MTNIKPKVAVVGCAPCTRKHGRFIDQCDIVIRFNNFKTEGFEEYVGTKTTIWCYSSNIFEAVKVQQCKSFNEIWIVQRPAISSAMRADAEARNCKVYPVPKEYDQYAKDQIKSFPSTGIVGIYAALQQFGSPIFVSGFRGFRKYELLHYFEERSVTSVNTPHNGDAERKLLNTFHQNGLIVPLLKI